MKQEDRDSFRQFVQTRSQSLFRTALLLTGDSVEAEELLQSGLVKTCLAWHRLHDQSLAESYVYRTMVNTRIGWWRHRSRECVRFDQRDQPDLDPAVSVSERDAILRALRELPRRQRAAVVLRYYEDLSEAQTAAALGVSVGSVKSATSRGLARLRHDLSLNEQDGSKLKMGGRS